MDKIHYRYIYPKYLDNIFGENIDSKTLWMKLNELCNTEPDKFELQEDIIPIDLKGDDEDIIFQYTLVDKGKLCIKEFFEPCEE